MTWDIKDKQGDECGKIRWELVPYTRGLGYDIGCGPYKAFPHFISIDNRKDTTLFDIPMDPDLTVPDACHLPMLASAHADFVFSSHTLEHIQTHEKALREWWRIIKPGGHLVLYLPHKNLYPNVGTTGANPDHVHDFLPSDIIECMKKIGGWDLVKNEDRNETNEYSFFQVYKKYADAKLHRFSCDEPKPAKTCIICRFGAWGDVIQMSSILPALKAQGYHITLMTVPRAWEAVQHEPLIDRVMLQDPDQVPNMALGEYWKYWKTRCDRFINLSESVEGTMLAMPGRLEFDWPKAARETVMNQNYIEFTHKIAGVPFDKPRSRFVATDEEKKWAVAQKAKIGADPLIMWVLAGSSIHKVWEGIDRVIARVMVTMKDAKIVTVGDERCKNMIEAPWVQEPRIVRRSGEMTIRQTMALAQVCDLVIGPETGVMSAVAMEPMKKIILLSHSTKENLTRDWVNTQTIAATEGCFACHKMVFTWDQCVKDETTGTSQCMVNIHPDEVWNALCLALEREELAA